MGKFNLARTACIIFAFCIAAGIASPAQTYTTLLSFDGTNGADPSASLVQGPNGGFYGTASPTVFEVTPEGGLTTLYDSVSVPLGLTLATDRNYYGMTEGGGAHEDGTIFEITPAGQLTTIYSFCSGTECETPTYPEGTLVQGRNGNLYGTTLNGGTADAGAVFEITPGGEFKFTTLYSFCSQPSCSDGEAPTGLVQASNGNLYGTTYETNNTPPALQSAARSSK